MAVLVLNLCMWGIGPQVVRELGNVRTIVLLVCEGAVC